MIDIEPVQLRQLIDTHAHLDEIDDLEGAILRAKEKGIKAIIGVGQDFSSSVQIWELSQRYKGYVFPALGVHPSQIERDDLEKTFEILLEKGQEIVAIGETGLDYKFPTPTREKQKAVLKRLADLAGALKKPLIVHSRDAQEDVLSFLKEIGVKRVIFHWYSGPEVLLDDIFDNGYFVSATPAISYSKRHKYAVLKAPLDQLILETDSPVRYRGIEAEPAQISSLAHMIAELRGISFDEVAFRTTRNAIDLFSLPF